MQRHDIGYQKNVTGQKPKSREALALERAKRRHPGPLPERGKNKYDEDEDDRNYRERIMNDLRSR